MISILPVDIATVAANVWTFGVCVGNQDYLGTVFQWTDVTVIASACKSGEERKSPLKLEGRPPYFRQL
jgi:hypothetical protein